MKKSLLLGGLLLALALPARATVVDWTYSGGSLNITDGNAVGVFNTYTLANAGTLAGVTVDFALSGGQAGDLVGYLILNNGGTTYAATLFNRPGVSLPTNPFGSLLNASSLNQTGQNVLSSFGSGSLSLGDNSTWTLYLADLATGGGTAQMTGWGLHFDVTPVPEPATWALLGFASLTGLAGLARRRQRRTA